MSEQKNPRGNPFGISLIPQLFNTCGLSTILMLTGKSPHLSQTNRFFLSRVLELIQPILIDKIKNMDREISLQYALQYLLLKIENRSTINYEFIYHFLHNKFGHVLDDQVAIHTYLMTMKMDHLNKTQNYSTYDSYRLYMEKKGIITTNLLRNEMFTMKSDLELKFLMEIFGYQFIPNESGDGTGALFIANKKRKNDFEKIQLLLTEISSNSNYRILYGVHNHWVAVTGMSEEKGSGQVFIHYNDPMIPEAKTIPLDEIDGTHRFYIFKESETDVVKLWEMMEQVIVQEIQIEKNLQNRTAVEKVLASREEVNIDLVKELNLSRKISMLQADRESKSHLSINLHPTKTLQSTRHSGKEKDWDTDVDFEFEDQN
ncbi:MAG: hypothetical protein E4G98_06305 [Promethearchaeota archaeon]|nr:MAG: hypothetical protein E4G98_06305 [Candidatus Lokiarchaeota archaeon]